MNKDSNYDPLLEKIKKSMKAPLYLIAAILSAGLAILSKSEAAGVVSFIFFTISCGGVIISWIVDIVE